MTGCPGGKAGRRKINLDIDRRRAPVLNKTNSVNITMFILTAEDWTTG
jgi:hypothetical protein